MNKIYLGLSFFFIFITSDFSAFGQSLNSVKTTTVGLFVEKQKRETFKKLKIYVIDSIGRKQSFNLRDSTVIVPLLNPKQQKVTLLVKYGRHHAIFKNIDVRLFSPDQNVKWIFGIDKQPFDRSLGVTNKNDWNNTKISEIFYWRYQPQEYGDGLLFVDKTYTN